MTLCRAAERLEQADWRNAETEKLENAVSDYNSASRTGALDRIRDTQRDDTLLVPTAEVASIVADGARLRRTSTGDRRYDINFRLKDLEVRLDERKFVRLSRGALANPESISHVSPGPGGTYLISLKTGQEIPSSRLQSR